MIKKAFQTISILFEPSNILEAEKEKWKYIFGVLLLFGCGIRLYYGLQNIVDIQYADEAAYMRFGLNLFGEMRRDWGPMYAVWYKCLSFVTTDTIELYYINYVITSVLVGVLLYVYLLRISVHSAFALLIAFSILVSDLNVSVWPRISHFCIVLCLIVLIIITYLKNTTYKFLLFTTMCLVVAYARPEFYLSFVLSFFATICCIYYNRKTFTKKDIPVFLLTIIAIILLHIIFRFPSNDFFGYNRSVAAFYQHYAWNYKWRTGSTIDAWLYWEDLAKQQFGDCNSMWCIIKSKPSIFISNTLFNIKNYFVSIFANSFSYIFPLGIFHGRKLKLLLTVIIAITFIALLSRKTTRIYFKKQIIEFRFYLLLSFIFCAPTFISCMLIFPRDHYLYLQMLFLLLILISVFGVLFESISLKPIVFIVFGSLLLLATPNIDKYKFLKTNTSSDVLCNKKLVTHLEKNYSDKPHVIFTNLPFINGILPTNFKEINTVFGKKKEIPFTHYLDSAQIDIVILIPSILRDPHIKSDSTWLNFLNNYEQYHFKKDDFNACETTVLIKQK